MDPPLGHTKEGNLAMIDEHFMRTWNDGHVRFSADIDRAVDSIGRLLGSLPGKRAIDGPYVRRPANTLLGGLAAVATTVALVVSVAVLAAPPAAGKASAPVALA